MTTLRTLIRAELESLTDMALAAGADPEGVRPFEEDLDDVTTCIVDKLLVRPTVGSAGQVWATSMLASRLGYGQSALLVEVPRDEDGGPADVVYFEGPDGHVYAARVVGVVR